MERVKSTNGYLKRTKKRCVICKETKPLSEYSAGTAMSCSMCKGLLLTEKREVREKKAERGKGVYRAPVDFINWNETAIYMW